MKIIYGLMLCLAFFTLCILQVDATHGKRELKREDDLVLEDLNKNSSNHTVLHDSFVQFFNLDRLRNRNRHQSTVGVLDKSINSALASTNSPVIDLRFPVPPRGGLLKQINSQLESPDTDLRIPVSPKGGLLKQVGSLSTSQALDKSMITKPASINSPDIDLRIPASPSGSLRNRQRPRSTMEGFYKDIESLDLVIPVSPNGNLRNRRRPHSTMEGFYKDISIPDENNGRGE